MDQHRVASGGREGEIDALLGRLAAALPDLGTGDAVEAVIDVHVEVIVAVRQRVEEREPEVQLVGGNVDQVRGNAIGAAEREGLGRVVVDEAVDDQRQPQSVDARRVRARVAELDVE